jgi:hypothetical protein
MAPIIERWNRQGQARGRLLFVNKKKQKNFLCWAVGNVGDNAHGPA